MTTPEKMTIICNIQMMWEKIGVEPSENDFEQLDSMPVNVLRKKQANVLKEYNQQVKKKQSEEDESLSNKRDLIYSMNDLETPQVLTDELKDTIISSIEGIKEVL